MVLLFLWIDSMEISVICFFSFILDYIFYLNSTFLMKGVCQQVSVSTRLIGQTWT